MVVDKDFTRSAMTQAVFLGLFLVMKFYFSISVATSFISLVMTLCVPFFVYFLQKKYKNSLEDASELTFSMAYRYGVSLFFYAVLILVLGQFVYFRFINPNYIHGIYSDTMEVMKDMLSAEQMKELENAGEFSVTQMIITSLCLNNFLGIIISLVTSLFVVKK